MDVYEKIKGGQACKPPFNIEYPGGRLTLQK